MPHAREMRQIIMSPSVQSLLWPAHRLPEAIEALSRELGIAHPGSNGFVAHADPNSMDEETLKPYMEKTASELGVEVEPVECFYAEIQTMLLGGRSGPPPHTRRRR